MVVGRVIKGQNKEIWIIKKDLAEQTFYLDAITVTRIQLEENAVWSKRDVRKWQKNYVELTY